MGTRPTPRFQRLAVWGCGLGWPVGIAISSVFAVTGQFGPYRQIYCMVPERNYKPWVLSLVGRAVRGLDI